MKRHPDIIVTEFLEIEKGKRPQTRSGDTEFVSTHLRMKKNVSA